MPVAQNCGLQGTTYAQNLCCGAPRIALLASTRYQSHSVAKLLIHIASLNCFFYGQFKQSLDLQGPGACEDNLSTKLSTEIVKIRKEHLNQALSAFFACVFENARVNPRNP